MNSPIRTVVVVGLLLVCAALYFRFRSAPVQNSDGPSGPASAAAPGSGAAPASGSGVPPSGTVVTKAPMPKSGGPLRSHTILPFGTKKSGSWSGMEPDPSAGVDPTQGPDPKAKPEGPL